MTLLEEGVARSRQLLTDAATPEGFVASTGFGHYSAVWARDACLTALGGLAVGDGPLVEAAGATVDTLLAAASPQGRVPVVVRPGLGWDWGEGGGVDPSAWVVVAAAAYLRTTGDFVRVEGWFPRLEAAMAWLAHQDVTGSGLISAAPATDWMDAALTRSGRTLHLNVLYYWAQRSLEEIGAALHRPTSGSSEDLSWRIDLLFWPQPQRDVAELYPHGFGHDALRVAYWEAAQGRRRHYVSHVVHSAFVDLCDVAASCLAVVSGAAGGERAQEVVKGLSELAVAEPLPSRTYPEPVEASEPWGMWIRAAEAVIPPRWRNPPGSYHNGAVWPYVGALHARAEATAGRHPQARRLLEQVAAANRLGVEGEWEFREWITPTDEPRPAGAPQQVWNAGTLLWAAEALGLL